MDGYKIKEINIQKLLILAEKLKKEKEEKSNKDKRDESTNNR